MSIKCASALAIALLCAVGAGCGAGSAEGALGSLRPVAVGAAVVPVEGKPTVVIVKINTGPRGAQ